MPTPLDAIADLVRACQPLPSLVTGGQPTAAHLAALTQAGVGIVIDLRDPMEDRRIDEPALVTQLGMEYVNVPIATGTLDDATVERILSVLRRPERLTAFMHCGSGSRAGGVLLPYFLIDLSLPEDEAVTKAMQVGLRSAEYLEWGLDYARRTRQPGREPR